MTSKRIEKIRLKSWSKRRNYATLYLERFPVVFGDTGEDAKRIATALFGNKEFYEMEPLLDPSYSKADLRAVIARWTSYPNKTEAIENTIQMYILLLETAPEENPHFPAQWTSKKESHYIESAENIEGLNPSTESDTIPVTVKDNGIPYLLYFFCKITKNDLQFHSFLV